MNTLTNQLVERIMGIPKKAAISHTKLRGGTTIDGLKINYSIAEALATLSEIEKFGFCEMDESDLFIEEPLEGYFIQNGALQAFLQFDLLEKKPFQLYLNQTEEAVQQLIDAKGEGTDVQPYQLLQAFVTAFLHERMLKTDVDPQALLLQVREAAELKKEDPLASSFAILVNQMEKALLEIPMAEVRYAERDGELNLDFEDESAYDEMNGYFGDRTAPEAEESEPAPVPEQPEEQTEEMDLLSFLPQEEEEEEEEESSEKAVEAAEAVKDERIESRTEEPSVEYVEELVEELVEEVKKVGAVQPVQTVKEATYTQTPPSVQGTPFVQEAIGISEHDDIIEQTKKSIQAYKPQPMEISKEEVAQRRPLVTDDEAVRAYLRQFDFETYKPFVTKEEFIEAVIQFRTEQREENVPLHAMLQIEPRMIYVGDPVPFETALKNMLVDVHTILKGPAGAGKTVIAQTVSAVLNMPLYTMNGSSDSDTDIIVGSKEAANGTTYGVDGRLVMAMKNAGIFYADEVNFVLPEILSVVNAALDHRKEIYNDNVGEDVLGHRNFRFVGAMNVGYEGTRKLNKATANRSVSVVVDYMKPEYLKEYLRTYDPGYTAYQKNVLKMDQISEADVILLVNIAKALQQAVKNPKIALEQEAASVRSIEQLLKMTRTMPFETAIKSLVHNFDDEETRTSMVGVLKGISRLNIKVEEFLV